MTLSVDQQAEVEKAVTRVVYFVEFQFLSGTQRVSSLNANVEWGGYTWLGLGGLGEVSQIQESDGPESSPLNFTLNVAQSTWLSIGIGDVTEYRGRNAKMYMCPLDENFVLVGTPVICWRGIMDMMSVGVEGESGKVTLKCETSSYGLKRRQGLRINAAQQKSKYPTDTGFDYLTDLINKPYTWLSKKFQSV